MDDKRVSGEGFAILMLCEDVLLVASILHFRKISIRL